MLAGDAEVDADAELDATAAPASCSDRLSVCWMSSDLIVREDGEANVCPDDRRSGILAAAAERDGEGILTGTAGSRVQRGVAPGVKNREEECDQMIMRMLRGDACK